jgi:hypothetical protein
METLTTEATKKSITANRILIGLGVVCGAAVVFSLGTMAGYHKARFAEHFGENYERNFFGERQGRDDRGFMGNMHNRFDLPPSGHGAVGRVLSVSLPNFVVIGSDNLEKVITVTNETLVRKFREEATTADIAVGMSVAVLGDPNELGAIQAKFIRVMPGMGFPLPTISSTTQRVGTTTNQPQ